MPWASALADAHGSSERDFGSIQVPAVRRILGPFNALHVLAIACGSGGSNNNIRTG
jgi:hypothetical protein